MAYSLRNLPLLVCVACFFCGCAKTPTTPRSDSAAQSSTTENQNVMVSPEVPLGAKPIARVLGKEIFESDLTPPEIANNQPAAFTDAQLREYRQTKLQSLIWQPLMDKYCLERQLEPTAEEIEQYKQTVGKALSDSFRDHYLQSLQNSLESDELTDSQKSDASELIKLLEAEGAETTEERLIRYFRLKLQSKDLGEEKSRAYAEYADGLQMLEAEQKRPNAEMKWWKFNRAIHAQYGGAVIFQQSNPFEPVGAYRKWLEHHEEVGDFEILHDATRAAFWDYYNRDWESTPWVIHDPDPLDQPWWLKSPTEEINDDRP